MPVEILDDVVEWILDKLGVYNACAENLDDCNGTCRCCMSAHLNSRIREAIANEKKLNADKAVTFYVCREPKGPYCERMTMSAYPPRINPQDKELGYHWYHHPRKGELSYCVPLSNDAAIILGLHNLKPGYCRNLNTGVEFCISDAESIFQE
jgi:hypothetical protein